MNFIVICFKGFDPLVVDYSQNAIAKQRERLGLAPDHFYTAAFYLDIDSANEDARYHREERHRHLQAEKEKSRKREKPE